ncbi:MAG: DUF2812 domain-containing protein [Clostridia bacterium]|nr:DUF2812 domain-containing protein [Clostridia bacterium]
MRKRKYRLAQFTFYDRTGIAADLTAEAARGWMLDKVSYFFWRFRRIEPRALHFAVSYFPKASVFDPEPGEEQRSFEEFCLQSGWQLVGSAAQMQIFCNERENPVPLETDALVELENIHKAAKRGFLLPYLLLMITGLLQMGLFLSSLFRDSLRVLGNSGYLFTGFSWAVLLCMTGTELLGYFRWRSRAKKAALEDGSFVPTKSTRRFQLACLWVVLVLLVLYFFSLEAYLRGFLLSSLALPTLVIASVIGTREVLKRWKVSTGINRAVTLGLCILLPVALSLFTTRAIFAMISDGRFQRPAAETYVYNGQTFSLYRDPLPLYVSDLLEIDDSRYSAQLTTTTSPLIATHTAVHRPRLGERNQSDLFYKPDLSYTVTEVRFAPLYGFCRRALLEQATDRVLHGRWGEYLPIEPTPEGVLAAYRLSDGVSVLNRWLLCYEDHFVELQADWALTAEQLEAAGQRLAGGM